MISLSFAAHISGSRRLSAAQRRAPLFEAMREYARKDMAPFHTPGHKQGRGIAPDFLELIGEDVFRIDLCELPEVDNLYNPEGPIMEAQALAAEAYGADHSFFLVNGSTTGNIVMVMAAAGPGDTLIVPRNAHKSVAGALILSGARPAYLSPAWDSELGVAHCAPLEEVERALKEHPDAKAVLVVNPTYYGGTADLARIAALCRAHDKPLLVDEAHGPHLHFHPRLPISALDAGADMVVQSTHKVISGMTQSSLLHVKGSRISVERIRKILQIVQSTSPSYVLMASLDVARRQMALSGEALLGRALELAEDGRRRLRAVPGVHVFGKERCGSGGLFDLDETKLTINVTGLGMTGFEAKAVLNAEYGVQAEMATIHNVLLIVSIGNTRGDIDRVVRAFEEISQQAVRRGTFGRPAAPRGALLPSGAPAQRLTPRSAFYAPTETVPFESSVGRTSAELVAPYPPGVPVLTPGEVISLEAVEYLREVERLGGLINGPEDAELRTIKVVASA